MKKVILFLVLLSALSVVIGLGGCGGTTPPLTYTIGDTGPAGGLIFYDKGGFTDGWQYLEAAPTDQDYNGDYTVEWGCLETEITGADGTAVDTGEQNTIDIEAGCTTAGTPADICANLSIGAFDDWFLPSQDELNLMYENLKVSGLGGFADSGYWSSSEGYAGIAWGQDFYYGFQHYYYKFYTLRVRAVRAF